MRGNQLSRESFTIETFGATDIRLKQKNANSTYLIELFSIDELEEFRRGVQLVGRPGQRGQCVNL
eukprot:7468765-Pyramimonas_sp.AAC.1